jgi:hypothetical protein
MRMRGGEGDWCWVARVRAEGGRWRDRGREGLSCGGVEERSLIEDDRMGWRDAGTERDAVEL